MEAATCGHTPDNNKNALYGVLSVSLIASVAVAVVQGILIAYAADVASLAYFAALVAVCVGKIVGLCLGLAGTSMANSSKHSSSHTTLYSPSMHRFACCRSSLWVALDRRKHFGTWSTVHSRRSCPWWLCCHSSHRLHVHLPTGHSPRWSSHQCSRPGLPSTCQHHSFQLRFDAWVCSL